MNNKLIAKELLTIAKDLICFDTLKTARGQGRIRDEIQKSCKECLRAIKVPENLPNVETKNNIVWVIHHMDPSKKFKLNGEMTKTEFKNMVEQIENGLPDNDLNKFKEELDTIIIVPKWFHEHVHSKKFNSQKIRTRESLYSEMDRIVKEEADTIDKFQLKGNNISKWLDTLKEMVNTFKIPPSEHKKIQEQLKDIRKILLDGRNK